MPALDLNAAIAAATRRARASGALQPIPTRVELLQDHGLSFVLRVADLRRKSESERQQRESAQPANPFLPYDPAMFVADLSATHVLLLNKFQVLAGHALVVTRAYAEQEAALEPADFAAVGGALRQTAGLAFFNSGAAAGASQRHRHVQLLPWPLLPVEQGEPFDPRRWAQGERGAGWPFAHAWATLAPDDLARPERLLAHYSELLGALGMGGAAGYSGYNLLMTPDWMMAVRRSKGVHEGLGVNALGFAGTLLLRDEAQLQQLRELGALALLRAVTRSG
ncbi:phosphorylase [Solimonas sp. K1W22B-7]|uniref:phosphorylase n=1 Tax=Solimonas sp. K1W22B-7 TaxID=2303331 RepID=UPI000E32DF47|nr:phosphorylase [Solimonas sp. K1W22B-7]AXQ31356.1 phosphorylase [Solimonas sp. K1W22B-7]